MIAPLTEIHARLRAADRALAMAPGGSSELAYVREAVGSLLVAVHELAGLYAQQPPASTQSLRDGGTVGGPSDGRRRKP